MSIRRLTDRDINLEVDRNTQGDEEQTQHLVLVLRDLIDRLSRQIRGGPTTVAMEIERWEGGGYFYVETVLKSSAIPEIDVSIQGGRAFIRMAR
jgi:hypothetical protein